LKKSIFVLTFLFAVLVAPFAAIGGTWYAEYDAALNAIADKDWASAEAKLKTAMQLQPKQGRQVLAYGIRFIRYIPQYYLGVVYFHQGKYQDSLNQFEKVEKNGLVTAGDPEYGEMNKLTQQAGERLKPRVEEQKPPVATPSSVIDQLKAKERPLETELQTQPHQEEKRKRDEFENLMQRAKAALSTNEFAQSREFAKQAATIEAGNPELIRLQSLIDRTQKIQDLEDRGVLAFLSGDYAAAILLLERVTLVKKDYAETWFYLACSHAATGLLKGKDGNEILLKAQREFAQARKLDSKFKYIPGLISPRILELYEQAR
jgi:tetratricopeptide (TPR) repeat protein